MKKFSGPCWGYSTSELCFTNKAVEIVPNGVFNYSGISDPNVFFTGSSDFEADEIEVFITSGRIEVTFHVAANSLEMRAFHKRLFLYM